MVILQDNFIGDVPEANYEQANTDHWFGQTFAAVDGYEISRVDIYVGKGVGDDVGIVTVAIYATDGSGNPTGSALVSGTIANVDIPETDDWVTCNFGSPYLLADGVRYAVVWHCSGVDASNVLKATAHDNGVGASSFVYGNQKTSTNGGSSWVTYTTQDFRFKCYGTSTYTLYENYHANILTSELFNDGTKKWGQSFTPSTTHLIKEITLFLWRASNPGTINVEIYLADENNYPTGDVLCSGFTDGDTLELAGEWRKITLGDGAVLTSSTKYVIVLNVPNADGSNIVYWERNNTGTYTGGVAIYNGGAGWTYYSSKDFSFREYGGSLPVITDQSGDTSVELGKIVNFFVTASGDPTPTYQWYKDDIILSGETNSTLSFYSNINSSGTYKCKVSNPVGDVWSNPIVLTVISNPYRYDLFGLHIDADRI